MIVANSNSRPGDANLPIDGPGDVFGITTYPSSAKSYRSRTSLKILRKQSRARAVPSSGSRR